MASSFRIKLKVPANNNGGAALSSPKKAQQSMSPYTPSPPQPSSPVVVFEEKEAGSSVLGMDEGSSVNSDSLSGVVHAEEEEDELEDSPPPQSLKKSSAVQATPTGGRVASYGQVTGKVRKLSGAAAMKAANSLKRASLSTAAGAQSASPGAAAASTTGTPAAAGSTNVEYSKSPSPASEVRDRTSQSLSPGLSPSNSASTTGGKRRQILASLGRPIEEMSLAEIEALPAAKRRKGLKARGAAGPGRGWRKGLKMDQKPVYRQPGESPPAAVAPTTPSSFGAASKPKSALGRDAYSKTATPTRQSSPNDDAMSASGGSASARGEGTPTPAAPPAIRTFSASSAAVAARKARARGEDLAPNTSNTSAIHAAASAIESANGPAPPQQPVRALGVSSQAEEGRLIKAIMRGGPSVLPPPRIPVGFVTSLPLDRSSKAVRKWQKRDREVLSLGGKVWSAVTWMASSNAGATAPATATTATEPSSTNPRTDIALRPPATGTATPAMASRATTPTAGTAADSSVNVSPSTSTKGPAAVASGTPLGGSPAPGPCLAMARGPSSSDWKGSSAAFTAANRGRS
jgi:hypothetical protein